MIGAVMALLLVLAILLGLFAVENHFGGWQDIADDLDE